jgi:hypothetical protein
MPGSSRAPEKQMRLPPGDNSGGVPCGSSGAPGISTQDARVNLMVLQQTDWRQCVDRFVR